MKQQKHRQPLPGPLRLERAFPWHQYPEMRPGQREALELIEQHDGRVTLGAESGQGKTVIAYTFLRRLAELGVGPLFYVVPTKTMVDQVWRLHPDLTRVYGRNEHLCLYYPGEDFRADEIPCLLLVGAGKCPHFVNQKTGAVHTSGAVPCPYYQQKFEARQSPIIVCTMAFYLFHQLFPSSQWEPAQGLVIDEAHRMAQVVRNCLSYEITDYHLFRAADLLEGIDAVAAKQLKAFGRTMIHIIKRKPAHRSTLLNTEDIEKLILVLEEVDASGLERKLQRAVARREVDPVAQRHELKQLEVIIRDLHRYLHSFEFALPDRHRGPLNYTYAYYVEEKGERERVQYRLVVKAYYVAPLIEKILAPRTVAMSATIGEPSAFEYETGIRADVYNLPSDFPMENTRVFLPTDTPNLAVKSRKKGDLKKILRRVARACKRFASREIRSLVVMISEAERLRFLELCTEENVRALSYGNGLTAKEVAAKFRDGEGDVLVGTAAQYGEGIDLPKQVAPVIFMLRPGYPRPDDPGTQFEEQRFSGSRVWAIRNWRVMVEALQVRGRNIRSAEDLGVTFFISRQFDRFLYASLPGYLKAAYREKPFGECVEEAINLLTR